LIHYLILCFVLFFNTLDMGKVILMGGKDGMGFSTFIVSGIGVIAILSFFISSETPVVSKSKW